MLLLLCYHVIYYHTMNFIDCTPCTSMYQLFVCAAEEFQEALKVAQKLGFLQVDISVSIWVYGFE